MVEAATDKKIDEPAADAPAQVGPVKMKLRKPILKAGEPTTEIEFREPTGLDITRIGNPVSIDFFSGDTPEIKIDDAKMSKMLARLSGLPDTSIDAMNSRDRTTAGYLVAPFFMPDLGTAT